MRNAFFLGLLSVLLLTRVAIAGDCRDALHPLLLSTAADAGQLQLVRTLCTDAYGNGDADAGYQLAIMDLGLDRWSPDTAVPLIREAAAAGVPEAQYWLAWQYESGPLLPDDSSAAQRWYEAAAAQEHRLALQRLADAYAKGELGVPVNRLRATELRARAERCARQAG
jgi:TPR repeat protein